MTDDRTPAPDIGQVGVLRVQLPVGHPRHVPQGVAVAEVDRLGGHARTTAGTPMSGGGSLRGRSCGVWGQTTVAAAVGHTAVAVVAASGVMVIACGMTAALPSNV